VNQKQLEALIAQAATCSSGELATLWSTHLRGRCPGNVLARRQGFAWRLQAQAQGGLPDRTKRRLRELELAFAADADHQPSRSTAVKPGTQFVRYWKGRSHTVQVTRTGFLYTGTEYRSLSEIARAITGTRWSGPRFFGIKGKRNA
jgi:hypothetical protein